MNWVASNNKNDWPILIESYEKQAQSYMDRDYSGVACELLKRADIYREMLKCH